MASLLNNIAPAYNPTESYSFGAKTLNNDHLYQCIKSTTGPFDPDAWTEIYLSDLIQGGMSMDGLEPVLLWTNTSPSSIFAAQTISLDLSNYAGVLVESNSNISSADYGTRIYCKIGETKMLGRGTNATASLYKGGSSRAVTVSANGVTFADCWMASTLGNDDNIPVKIYGVKKVVVEPVSPAQPLSDYHIISGTSEVQAIATADGSIIPIGMINGGFRNDFSIRVYINNELISTLPITEDNMFFTRFDVKRGDNIKINWVSGYSTNKIKLLYP